jgi:hypothetical protein
VEFSEDFKSITLFGFRINVGCDSVAYHKFPVLVILSIYLNFAQTFDTGKKAQSLKGQILSNQQTISQHRLLPWDIIELSKNMKIKGGSQYVVSAIFFNGNR